MLNKLVKLLKLTCRFKRYKKGLKWGHFGPFDYYKLSNGGISAWLHGYSDKSWGWEYGNEVDDKTLINIKIFGLSILYISLYKIGFHLEVMGFWIIV